MTRLLFKLFLNGDNAPEVLAWMTALAVALYAAIAVRRCWARRVAERAAALREENFRIARELFGQDFAR